MLIADQTTDHPVTVQEILPHAGVLRAALLHRQKAIALSGPQGFHRVVQVAGIKTIQGEATSQRV